MQAQSDFIRASDAYGEVLKLYARQENEQTQRTLIRRLASGALKAKALGTFQYQVLEAVSYNQDGVGHEWVQRDVEDGLIPIGFWHSLKRNSQSNIDIDWFVGDFFFEISDERGTAHGVVFERLGIEQIIGRPLQIDEQGEEATLPNVIGNNLPADPVEEFDDKPKGKGGAPRKWDWDGALLHLAAMAHHGRNGLFRDDGGDPNQSDIAGHLGAWFIDTCDNSPVDSHLRGYGMRFLTELNALKLRDAKNLKGEG